MFVTLLASYFVLLHRLTGQSQLSVGHPCPLAAVSGARTVGAFANPVVLRAENRAASERGDLLKQLRLDSLACAEKPDLSVYRARGAFETAAL